MLVPQALKYFSEVARTGSLRNAAEFFDIVPSAISRQIVQLERHLGVTLFERSTRGMTLTEAGRTVLAHVNDSSGRVDDLRRRLDDLTGLRRGTVRLAAVEATTNTFLPRAITAFSSLHPGVDFRVSVCGTAEIAERLASGGADIALAFNSPSRDDLVLKARIPQPLKLICAPGHWLRKTDALSMRRLDGLPAALPDRSFGIRRLIERAETAARIRLQVALECDSLQLIKNVVATSELVSFMPVMTFERELAGGTLAAIELQDTAFSRASIDVLTARGRELSHAAKRFLGFLVAQARS